MKSIAGALLVLMLLSNAAIADNTYKKIRNIENLGICAYYTNPYICASKKNFRMLKAIKYELNDNIPLLKNIYGQLLYMKNQDEPGVLFTLILQSVLVGKGSESFPYIFKLEDIFMTNIHLKFLFPSMKENLLILKNQIFIADGNTLSAVERREPLIEFIIAITDSYFNKVSIIQ